MWKNAVIGIQAIGFVVALTVLARVENQRHALDVGLCRDAKTGAVDRQCLSKVQTRTNPMWHLFYAFTD